MGIDVEVLECLVYYDYISDIIKKFVKLQKENPKEIAVLNYCDDSLSSPRYVIYIENKLYNDLYAYHIDLRAFMNYFHNGSLLNMYFDDDPRKITNPEDIVTNTQFIQNKYISND